MNLHINGLHLEITDSLRDYITTKLARINRHSDDIISATITLSTENGIIATIIANNIAICLSDNVFWFIKFPTKRIQAAWKQSAAWIMLIIYLIN